jgi:hypothetical protein
LEGLSAIKLLPNMCWMEVLAGIKKEQVICKEKSVQNNVCMHLNAEYNKAFKKKRLLFEINKTKRII